MAQESEFTNIGYGKVKPQLGQGAAQVLPNDLAAGDFRGKQLAAQNSARKQKREDAFAKQLADYDLSNPFNNPYLKEAYQRELNATNELFNGLRYDDPMALRKAQLAISNLEGFQQQNQGTEGMWVDGYSATDPNMIYSDALELYRRGGKEDLSQFSTEELMEKGALGGYHEGRVSLSDASKLAAELSEEALAAIPETEYEYDSEGNFDVISTMKNLPEGTRDIIRNSVAQQYIPIANRQYGMEEEELIKTQIDPYILNESSWQKAFKKPQPKSTKAGKILNQINNLTVSERIEGEGSEKETKVKFFKLPQSMNIKYDVDIIDGDGVPTGQTTTGVVTEVKTDPITGDKMAGVTYKVTKERENGEAYYANKTQFFPYEEIRGTISSNTSEDEFNAFEGKINSLGKSNVTLDVTGLTDAITNDKSWYNDDIDELGKKLDELGIEYSTEVKTRMGDIIIDGVEYNISDKEEVKKMSKAIKDKARNKSTNQYGI